MAHRVGFVVNTASETSVPASIALALDQATDLTVELVAWFGAEPFDGDEQLNVHSLSAPGNSLGTDFETYLAARDRLKTYDLVQVHHNHSGSIAKLLAHRLGLPIVSREGNTRNGFTRKGRIANGLTNRLADRIVCNSRAVYDSFTRWERLLVDDADVCLIPNGFDVERTESALDTDWDVREAFGVADDAILVGTAGHLYEQKAHDVLVEALDRAGDRSEAEFELVIAGEGPLRRTLEELAQSLGIADRVHLPGTMPRERVYALMDEAEVFAMPSRWEGFSNAAVEALGIGNACVFSTIDPFTIPYEDVALFHEVDDPDGLAGRLVEFAEGPQLRAEYEERGRALVRSEYSMESVVEQYSALYESLLERQP